MNRITNPRAFHFSFHLLLRVLTVAFYYYCYLKGIQNNIIIFRPHILQMGGGRKIMICDAFFPNFAKSPQSPPFDYLTIT